MDRALLLLAKQSSAAMITGGISFSKTMGVLSKSVTPINVEVDGGVGTGNESVVSKTTEDVSLRDRKRSRERDGNASRCLVLKKCDDSNRETVFKDPIIKEKVNLPPILQPVDPISSVRVKVSPDQHWMAGSNAPIQVFQVFDLPQDLTSYVDKSRAEIAERCLTRGGRFLSDLTHIVNSYKTDVNLQRNDLIARELSEVKLKKLEAEKRAAEAEKREVEAAKKSFNDKTKLMEKIRVSKDRVTSLSEELTMVKATADSEEKKYVDLKKDLDQARGELKRFEDENIALKAEVEKGMADVAKALGVGYGYCYDCLKIAGVGLKGHSFEDYCADLAKTMSSIVNEENPGNV